MASVNYAVRWSHVYYDTKAIHAQGWPHFLRIFYNAYTKNSLILVLTQFVWFLTKNKQNFHGHKIPSHSSLNLLEILMIFLFTAHLWFILLFWHVDKVAVEKQFDTDVKIMYYELKIWQKIYGSCAQQFHTPIYCIL